MTWNRSEATGGAGGEGMIAICPECGNTGFAVRLEAGVERASRCGCRQTPDGLQRFDNARIPRRYGECTLEGFSPQPTLLQSQAKAVAQRFVEEYPLGSASAGLIFLGPPGVGKTHLAVSILKALVLEKGVRGLFYDYGDLLRTIQSTWDRDSEVRESDILDPVVEAELLVLDDLGSARPSLWVQEILFHVLNSRYNANRIVLLTSNHPDTPGGGSAVSAGRARDQREASLEFQIGTRLRSRLYEMCRTVEMDGEDFRRVVKNAEIGR